MRGNNLAKNENQDKKSDYTGQIDKNRPFMAPDNADQSDNECPNGGYSRQHYRYRQHKVAEECFAAALQPGRAP